MTALDCRGWSQESELNEGGLDWGRKRRGEMIACVAYWKWLLQHVYVIGDRVVATGGSTVFPFAPNTTRVSRHGLWCWYCQGRSTSPPLLNHSRPIECGAGGTHVISSGRHPTIIPLHHFMGTTQPPYPFWCLPSALHSRSLASPGSHTTHSKRRWCPPCCTAPPAQLINVRLRRAWQPAMCSCSCSRERMWLHSPLPVPGNAVMVLVRLLNPCDHFNY